MSTHVIKHETPKSDIFTVETKSCSDFQRRENVMEFVWNISVLVIVEDVYF
jgi:hypothetical protein